MEPLKNPKTRTDIFVMKKTILYLLHQMMYLYFSTWADKRAFSYFNVFNCLLADLDHSKSSKRDLFWHTCSDL